MEAVLLTFVLVSGFLLGYVVRDIISQRRHRRALMQRYQDEADNLQPVRRVAEPRPTSPPLAPSAAEKAARPSKQPGSTAGSI
jgi:hypothetical protein